MKGDLKMITKKLWLGLLIGLLALGVTGVTFAHWRGGQEMGPPDPAAMRAEFQTGLNGLVEKKVIDAKQVETILQYFDKAAEELKGLPPYEVREKMRQMKTDGTDPLSLLVKDKVLTQEQAKAVQDVLHGAMGKGFHRLEMMKAKLENDLNVLAKSDFITAKQAETVLSYFERAVKELGKSESGPPCDKRATLWEKGKDPLSLLVKDGVITSKQADVIALLVPAPRMDFHEHHHHNDSDQNDH